MSQNICPQCGAALDPSATECKFCGEKVAVQYVQQPQQNTQQGAPTIIIQQTQPQQPVQPAYVTGINPSWSVKSKVVAGLLAIFLGGLGIHKFYLGHIGMGIIYLIFCWTWIPSFIAFFEGIIYLCSNDENFQLKHHVRLK